MQALEPIWEELKSAFSDACGEAERAERSRLVYDLNQLLRRFRLYQTEAEWTGLVLEGASAFAHQVALFALKRDVFLLGGQVNLEVPEILSFPKVWAAAFETVCTTNEQVTALRTPTEVTEALSTEVSGDRAHLFPIMNGARLAAVLFCSDGEGTDVNGLEMVAGMASSVLERQANAQIHARIASFKPAIEPEPEVEIEEVPQPPGDAPLIHIAATNGHALPEGLKDQPAERAAGAVAVAGGIGPLPSSVPPAPVQIPAVMRGAITLPAWAELDEPQRQLHIRAQRFARVTVAEMQLAKPEACGAGREQGNFYQFLNKEIDKARETFRKQFMTTTSMVDYFHLELIQTAISGDAMKLGADYPGPLV